MGQPQDEDFFRSSVKLADYAGCARLRKLQPLARTELADVRRAIRLRATSNRKGEEDIPILNNGQVMPSFKV